MAKDVKQRMTAGAVQLLATRGLEGTSFADVLELTGAPRGSIYHHFPGGKDELVAAALRLAGARTGAALEPLRGGTPTQVTRGFLDLWRRLLDISQLRAGCAVAAVTVAADSPDLLAGAADVFRGWTEQLTGLLVAGGARRAAARRFAILLISATEGAVVLARAQRERAAFDVVARALVEQSRALGTESAAR